MMNYDESRELPRDCIPPIAREMATKHKSNAVIPFFIAGVFALGIVATAGKKGDVAASVGAAALVCVIPAAIGFKQLKKSRAARELAGMVAGGVPLKFYLSGNMIAVSDEHGTPRPDLRLAISPKLRQSLVAVPAARALPKATDGTG